MLSYARSFFILALLCLIPFCYVPEAKKLLPFPLPQAIRPFITFAFALSIRKHVWTFIKGCLSGSSLFHYLLFFPRYRLGAPQGLSSPAPFRCRFYFLFFSYCLFGCSIICVLVDLLYLRSAHSFHSGNILIPAAIKIQFTGSNLSLILFCIAV